MNNSSYSDRPFPWISADSGVIISRIFIDRWVFEFLMRKARQGILVHYVMLVNWIIKRR